jgi:IS30 family transposase/DNA-binding CsgD family transcriptional regulator
MHHLRSIWCLEVVMRSWGLSAVEQDEVWQRWRRGESLRLIARRLGKRGPSVRAFVLQTGGVQCPPPRRAARALRLAEREGISRGLAAGDSCRVIAQRLGRAPATVSREVARNGGRRCYRAQTADAAADRRARRPKAAKLVLQPRGCVRWWRPSWRCVGHPAGRGLAAAGFPEDPVMRVSHETIYRSLFVQSRGALRRELQRCLRTGRAMRYPRGKRLPQGRGQLRDVVLVSERPAEAEDRAVPGHWEGDLLLGKRPSAVVTLVERASRYLTLVALPEGYKAEQLRPALAAAVTWLPEQLRRSLTWDQGKEMAEHAKFTVDTGVTVYFCDPRSPWQRGSNENTNGLLRQYLAKNADLRQVTQDRLDAIAAELNGRPRQTLGFQTPSQALAEALP